ncbi:S8 family peptidase [Pedobacter sp. Leaf250]|uniref:S8 family peptidase n=1 Tax=Pedobacter sp. Leaf250 TaxID=2876559 RepID=UPI001E41FC7F|nr:S8 family peptidase [Pedobacter sp. Leaf250]
MNEGKFHFHIPKDNIRIEKYKKTGFGVSFTRSNYSEHGKRLLDQYDKLLLNESKKSDYDLTSQIFFNIEVPTDRDIKNEKFKLQSLGITLINYSGKNSSIGTASIKKESYDSLIGKIETYKDSQDHRGKSNISIIENVSSIETNQKIDEIDVATEKIVSLVFSLFTTLPFIEKERVSAKLVNSLTAISTEAKYRIFGNGLCIITCKVQNKEIVNLVSQFSSICEVKYNSTSIITNAMPPLYTLPSAIKVSKPTSNSSICIIDSSINRHTNVFDGLVTKIETFLPSGSKYHAYDHGTFVASRCIFGDNLDDCLSTGKLTPYCKIMNVQVFGKTLGGVVIGHDISTLMGIIEDVVVENHKKIRVYNLSIGNDASVGHGVYSNFAKLLDYLTKKYKVLFVVACGNIRSLSPPYPLNHFSNPLSRINSPAESLLAISVGSIAKFFNDTSLAQHHEISPFSRVGPGVDGGIKPELVAHGGNLQSTYAHSPRLGTYGISGDGNGLCVDNGTSFSAPLISQFAQRLFDLYPKSNPNLIKSLLYHFCETRNVPKTVTANHKHYVGFGEPIIERAEFATANSGAFIYEGKLDQDNYQFVKFHIPKTLSENNKDSKLKVKITITYDPTVNINNDNEYSQSRISASLCKPTSGGMKEIGISDESTYAIPWNPIIHFEKSFTRSYLSGAWEVRLRLYTRGEIPTSYKQDYAITIEIVDTEKKVDVYSDIIHEFGSIYKRFKLRLAA